MVLALPRGGVPVAAEVAATLTAPLDLVLVRKIGLPAEPELAMGAVVDGAHPVTVRNEDVIRCAAIDEAEFTAVCERELAEIERRRQRYLGDRPRVDVAGRTVVVIDDGVAPAHHPHGGVRRPHAKARQARARGAGCANRYAGGPAAAGCRVP